MSETKAVMQAEPTELPTLEAILAGHLRGGGHELVIGLGYNMLGGHQALMYLKKPGATARSKAVNLLPGGIDVIVGAEDESWPDMLRTLAGALDKAITEVSTNG